MVVEVGVVENLSVNFVVVSAVIGVVVGAVVVLDLECSASVIERAIIVHIRAHFKRCH